MALWTEEARQAATTGRLRADCERLANNDDETAELIRRGYELSWSRDLFNSRLSLYKDGACTHGPDKGKREQVDSPFSDNDWNPDIENPCPRCHGWGGLAFDPTGGMAASCPDCDETGRRN